jgi:hypothetical protein
MPLKKCESNELKTVSQEAQIYFTLNHIIMRADFISIFMKANKQNMNQCLHPRVF